ncbi:hypothetical protein [Gallaecimonas sp. GXIMD4217]|uniref:hypothetical protein n=1 Tax=Gallaecimonas sp. GXIMD4217 TaxID=3131927 RepID=UPI00311B0013
MIDEQDKATELKLGGDPDKALRGEIQLDMKAILKEAWQHSRQGSLAMTVTFLALGLGWYGLDVLLAGLAPALGLPQEHLGLALFSQLLILGLTAPLITGLHMLGIFRSVGIPPSFRQALAWYPLASRLSLAALLSSVLVQLGLSLFLLPGLFLLVAFCFTLPLVADKGLSPLAALRLGLHLAVRYGWQILLVQLLGGLALMAGVLSFGLLFVWAVPWYFNLHGVLYRELFGVRLAIRGRQGVLAA